MRNQGPALLLHHCFLIAVPLFLRSLSPLISDYLNLPFGTQESSRKLKLFSHKQETRNTRRILYTGGPHRVVLLKFNFTKNNSQCA